MIWLRLHTELKDDRQLQQMPAEMFRQLVNIWCIVKEYDQDGKLPPVPDLAFQLRIEEDDCKSLITKLVAMSLLLKCDTGVTVKNWDFWQYRDDSRNRVAALRKRKKHGNETLPVTVGVTGDVTLANVTVTLTEQSRAEQSRADEKTVTPVERSPIEVWTERLCERHPAPSDPRYPATFCADNWHRLGESEVAYTEWMQAVYRGLEAWCEHWSIDGNRFAQSLDKWLSGGGWKKAPPKVVDVKANGKRDEYADIPLFDYKAEAAKRAALEAERLAEGEC